MPPLREEEAVAGAVLQRLQVAREGLAERETRARSTIAALESRLSQQENDAAREATLNRDAAETIARLQAEAEELKSASEGQDDALAQANETALEAARVLQAREEELTQLTEDLARLSARHQSVTRMAEDADRRVAKAETQREAAQATADAAQRTVGEAEAEQSEASALQTQAQAAAEAAEAALAQAEAKRETAQEEETAARTSRAEAEGAATTLRAEESALAGLLSRDTGEGEPLLDRVKVAPGFEAALGAAMGEDLRASEVDRDAETGWTPLAPYDRKTPLPDGIALKLG
jgi:chromosome segregation protein